MAVIVHVFQVHFRLAFVKVKGCFNGYADIFTSLVQLRYGEITKRFTFSYGVKPKMVENVIWTYRNYFGAYLYILKTASFFMNFSGYEAAINEKMESRCEILS